MRYILIVLILLSILIVLLSGCSSKEPWSSNYTTPEERDAQAQRAYWDVPKPFREEYPSESNRRQREQGNVLGW